MRASALAGTGVGWRAPLAPTLLTRADQVDFVELIAETLASRQAVREARALREVWPIALHGVQLSLGSAEGIDPARARLLAHHAREIGAAAVSEHVAFVRANGTVIGHLTELPHTRDAVRVVARNVEVLRRELPDIPLFLENAARGFVWQEGELSEGDFYRAVVEATGCPLLLDLGNLYANAVNAAIDPSALLASYPVDAAAMLHVAGGLVEDGFLFDTHAHAILSPVMDLAAMVLRERDVPLVLERDGAFEPLEVLGELARLRALPRGSRPAHRTSNVERALRSPAPALAAAQRALAQKLRSDDADAPQAVLRARRVLARKHVEAALGWLPLLSRRLDAKGAMRLTELGQNERSTVADAFRIALAASEDPTLCAAARHDALLLRARWSGSIDAPTARAAPFAGGTRLPSGAYLWALKGFGTNARVRTARIRGAPWNHEMR